MDGAIVFYCGEGDDFPVLLTAVRDQAFEVADELDDYYSGNAEPTEHHPRVKAALAVLARDVGTFVTIAVGTFEGGLLSEWHIVSD